MGEEKDRSTGEHRSEVKGASFFKSKGMTTCLHAENNPEESEKLIM